MALAWFDKGKTVAQLALEKQFTKAVRKEFERQGDETIKWLEAEDILEELYAYFKKKYPELYDEDKQEKMLSLNKIGDKADQKKVDALVKNWAEEVESQQMVDVLNKYTKKAGELGGKEALKKMKIRLAFNLKNPQVLKELAKRGEEITGNISARTLQDFKRVLLSSYTEVGMSPYDVKQKIKGMFEETYKNRAWTIARTETAVAQSQVKQETYTRNGVEKKIWRAIIDDRTRPAHREANGQKRDIDQPFDVGGEEMMQDHDPNASPENVINCRCTTEYVTDISKPYEPQWTGD